MNCNMGRYLNGGVCPHHGVIPRIVAAPETRIRKAYASKDVEVRAIVEFVYGIMGRPISAGEILERGKEMRFSPWNTDRLKIVLLRMVEAGVIEKVSPKSGRRPAMYDRRVRPRPMTIKDQMGHPSTQEDF